jgi:hypothetical protein
VTARHDPTQGHLSEWQGDICPDPTGTLRLADGETLVDDSAPLIHASIDSGLTRQVTAGFNLSRVTGR